MRPTVNNGIVSSEAIERGDAVAEREVFKIHTA